MGRTLLVHDIRDFGIVGDLQAVKFGIALSQAIVNDYLMYRLPSGNSHLTHPDCLASVVGTLMEDLNAFDQFDQAQIKDLLLEATGFLRTFIEHIDKLLHYQNEQVGVYPAEAFQRRVALIL